MNNKTLYRSTSNKMIGGVCSGLGEYFDIDPTVVRLVFALFFFGFGTGLMVYVLLWIIMPEENMAQPYTPKQEETSQASPAPVEGEVIEKKEE